MLAFVVILGARNDPSNYLDTRLEVYWDCVVDNIQHCFL